MYRLKNGSSLTSLTQAHSLTQAANQGQISPFKLIDPQKPIRSALQSTVRGQYCLLLFQTAMCPTPAKEMRSAWTFKEMNKLLVTHPALATVGITPTKAIMGAKFPLNTRRGHLYFTLSQSWNSGRLTAFPFTQTSPQMCHTVAVGCGSALATSQAVSGEAGLPTESL